MFERLNFYHLQVSRNLVTGTHFQLVIVASKCIIVACRLKVNITYYAKIIAKCVCPATVKNVLTDFLHLFHLSVAEFRKRECEELRAQATITEDGNVVCSCYEGAFWKPYGHGVICKGQIASGRHIL